MVVFSTWHFQNEYKSVKHSDITNQVCNSKKYLQLILYHRHRRAINLIQFHEIHNGGYADFFYPPFSHTNSTLTTHTIRYPLPSMQNKCSEMYVRSVMSDIHAYHICIFTDGRTDGQSNRRPLDFHWLLSDAS